MTPRILVSLPLILGGLLVAACDGGFSNAEAVERCNQEQMANPACMTTETQTACVVCFEDCGDGCAVLGTVCPTTFECIE